MIESETTKGSTTQLVPFDRHESTPQTVIFNDDLGTHTPFEQTLFF